MKEISQEGRERRRARIYETKPWLRSTGAKTDIGKAISSQNALRHGMRSANPLLQAIAHRKLWEKEKERIREIVRKQREAYSQSTADPHSSWQEVFEHLEEFLED